MQPIPNPQNLSPAEKRAMLAQLLQEKIKRSPSSSDKNNIKMENSASSNLEADAILDDAIVPDNLLSNVSGEPRAILLTGATGFLGAFLLDELLQQTSAKIYCLVRATNLESAQQRVKNNLENYFIWKEELSDRILAVPGDLSQPNLGLSPETFDRFTNELDAIYHNAAVTNFTHPYSTLKPINVEGTRQILALASQHRRKTLHYISTLGVFESTFFSKKVIQETDELPESRGQSFGYTQSKWVAEKMVRTASDRGLEICIYRPAIVSGQSETGCFNTDDFVWGLAKGCILTGKIPDLPGGELNMSPVDYVARAIVYLSKQPQAKGKAFHLSNPHPNLGWHQFAEWMRQYGYPLQTVSYDEWLMALKQSNPTHQKEMLHLLASVVDELKFMFAGALTASKIGKFDCQNTLQGLKGTKIICPPPMQLLNTYFSAFINARFLPSPLPK